MFNIALCDDEQSCLDNIHQYLKEYNIQHGEIEISVTDFAQPLELSESISKGNIYDIFLLDIYMPGITGISLAQELRKLGIESPVIFLTTSKDYALEAFGVRATHYLVKPFEKEEFFSALDAAIEKCGGVRRRQIVLKTDSGYQHIMLRDIVMCDTQKNYQRIEMASGKVIKIRMTSAQLYSRLGDYSEFARCGAAYIINLAHVKNISPKQVVLDNKQTISIPRGAYSKLSNQYFDYYCEGNKIL